MWCDQYSASGVPIMGNLRGAPLFLRPSVVRAVMGDIAALHRAADQLRMVELPVRPIALVDRPRASEDPRLAKANDNVLRDGANATGNVGESGAETPPESVPVLRQARGKRVAPPELQPEGWPDAPLPEHADPDLDRPAVEDETTSCSRSPVEESGLAGMAARECVSPNQRVKRSAAAPRKKRTPNPIESTPAPASALDQMPARSSAAPRSAPADRSMRMPLPIKGFHRQPTGLGDLTEAAQPAPRPDIRSLAEKLAAKRAAQAAKIDPVRLAAAYAREAAAKSTSVPAKQAPLVPAPSREECRHCGIPGWKGCDHYLPCADPRVIPARAEIYPAGEKGSISYKRSRSVISL